MEKIDFRFHVRVISRKIQRPEWPQVAEKVEAVRVVVGLSECRIDVCIIAIDFTKKFQAPSLGSVQESAGETPQKVLQTNYKN